MPVLLVLVPTLMCWCGRCAVGACADADISAPTLTCWRHGCAVRACADADIYADVMTVLLMLVRTPAPGMLMC